MTTEDVTSHLLETYGNPLRTSTFSKPKYRIDVYKWDAASASEGVSLYVTVGASQYPMPCWPDTHRVEYFVGLQPEMDAIARPLAGLAFYAHNEHVELAHAHTVPLGGALSRESQMDAFLVLKPAEDIVPPLEINGLHVVFLQAIPIFHAELEFKKAHGVCCAGSGCLRAQ